MGKTVSPGDDRRPSSMGQPRGRSLRVPPPPATSCLQADAHTCRPCWAGCVQRAGGPSRGFWALLSALREGQHGIAHDDSQKSAFLCTICLILLSFPLPGPSFRGGQPAPSFSSLKPWRKCHLREVTFPGHPGSGGRPPAASLVPFRGAHHPRIDHVACSCVYFFLCLPLSSRQQDPWLLFTGGPLPRGQA